MTMNEDERIQRFEQMATADPDNELGHFSLGKAYLDARRYDDASRALSRVLEINPTMSKAYQLLGKAHDRAGRRDTAIEVMTRGVTVADGQGDIMPRDAMANLLRKWGVPVPSFKESVKPAIAEPSTGSSDPDFRCARCGRPHGQLPKPPFKGALGEKVLAHVCTGCWQEWIGMGTKVINELGLVLSTPEGQDTYDEYMIEFLRLEEV